MITPSSGFYLISPIDTTKTTVNKIAIASDYNPTKPVKGTIIKVGSSIKTDHGESIYGEFEEKDDVWYITQGPSDDIVEDGETLHIIPFRRVVAKSE